MSEYKQNLENLIVAKANEEDDVAKAEFKEYVEQKAREIIRSLNNKTTKDE